MKNLIFTILIVIVLTSCGNQEKGNDSAYASECDSSHSYEPNYGYASDGMTNYYCEEAEEDEDIDLTANVTYYTSDGNIIYINRDSYGNISGHDINGNFIGGYSDEYGNTTMHDYNGNYTYSHTDEYGYTTGHDMNGNFYSAYTDDFGNTTVNVY